MSQRKPCTVICAVCKLNKTDQPQHRVCKNCHIEKGGMGKQEPVFEPPQTLQSFEPSSVGVGVFGSSPQPEKPTTNQKGTSELSQTPSKDSTSRSSAHENTCAIRIVRHLDLKNVFVVWYHPGDSASRLITLFDELREGVWQILPRSGSRTPRHPFWLFYSIHSEDHPNAPERLIQKEIEFDFFGYVDDSPTTRPKVVPNWTFQRENRKKEDSPDEERRKAVIFEVTQSQHVLYKLAQLELRLAVFLAKRRLKLKKLEVEGHLSIVDVVACAGLCIPEAYMEEVMAFVTDEKGMAEYLPLSCELSRAKAFFVIPDFEDRLGVPKVVQKPEIVWVQFFRLNNDPKKLSTNVIIFFVLLAILTVFLSGSFTTFVGTTFVGAISSVWFISSRFNAINKFTTTADPTKPSTATAFRVTPAIPDIDGLKDAVKAKIPEKLVGVASIDLKVYACIGEGAWAQVTKASATLIPNMEDTSYHVVVPS